MTLTHPLIDKLRQLRLGGMLAAYEQQLQQPNNSESLNFDERFHLLVDYEMTDRENRRLQARLRKAKLKQPACMEDIDYRSARGIDKSLLMSLAQCQWVKEHHNILIVGPTGIGKTYLACALAQKACLEGYTSHYLRMPRLFRDLSLAKGDGSYHKLMTTFAKTDVLILDDWGLAPLNDEQRRDLLELLDDRYNQRSTIVTSQLPMALWHENIGDSTLADAILDRLIHCAYKLELKGDSMRKKTENSLIKDSN